MNYKVLFDVENTGYVFGWNFHPLAMTIFCIVFIRVLLKEPKAERKHGNIPLVLLTIFAISESWYFVSFLHSTVNEKLVFLSEIRTGEVKVVEGQISNYELKYATKNHATFNVKGIEFDVGGSAHHSYSPPRHFAISFKKEPMVRVTYNKDKRILKFEQKLTSNLNGT